MESKDACPRGQPSPACCYSTGRLAKTHWVFIFEEKLEIHFYVKFPVLKR